MLFLGVDGGASKTAALLTDETGKVVGWGMAGASNYHNVGLDGMYASVSKAVGLALDDLKPNAVCYCMAAADMPHDFIQLRGKLKDLLPDVPFNVVNDVISIFRAGSRFPYGVGIVCGTGFNAGGISKAGEEFRMPALGDVTGDKQHLSYMAIGAAFRSWDGRGEPTALAQAILDQFGVPNYETLAEWHVQHKLTHAMIVGLAPLVFEVAETGDKIAQQLIRDVGIEFGTAANAALRRLNLTDDDCDVVLGGSLAHGKGSLLMDTVTDVVHQAAPKASVRRLDVPPVVGSVLLAADHVGYAVGESFIDMIRATLPTALKVPTAE